MAIMDKKAIEETAREDGFNEGFDDGFGKSKEAGLAKGRQERNIEIAKNLKRLDISIEAIIEATGLTKEEIEKL